jgi:cobalt-zinc-cadmium efflux system protein
MKKSPWWIRFRQLLTYSNQFNRFQSDDQPGVVDLTLPQSVMGEVHVPHKPKHANSKHFVQCLSPAGLHRMAYTTWGDPSNPRVLLCVHGLTRRGSDFAVLAQNMADQFYVVCPDVVGRGDSDHLKNPMFYGVPQYVNDMVTLIAQLKPAQLYWFGTSMGGLIGMVLAGLAQQPIERLLLNDVGPRIDPAFFMRLMQYLSKPVSYATEEQALQYVNFLTQTFGRHSPEQLRALNTPQLVLRDGVWGLHYDPQINVPIIATTPAMAIAGEASLWKSYDAIRIPTLIVRGAESDLLSEATVTEMCARNTHATSVTVPDAGHAPAFILPNQLQIARDFFA